MRVLALLLCAHAGSAFVSPFVSRQVSRQGLVKMAAESVEGAAAALSDGAAPALRTVKMSLPPTAVAELHKRRRRHSEETEEDADSPVAIAEEAAAESAPAGNPLLQQQMQQMALERSTQAPKGSIANMANSAIESARSNFWTGTVAPALLLGMGTSLVVRKTKAKFDARQEGLVGNYAFEMLKYDGNIPTLREVHAEYMQKLGGALAGKQKEACVLEYLRRFLAKRTLSGDAVKSVAYLVALHKLDDAKFASLLVTVGKEYKTTVAGDVSSGGKEQAATKPVSVGKVVFLGERILKDPDARAQLQTLKDDVVTYMYGEGSAEGAAFFESQQVASAEKALATFLDAGLPDTVKDLTDARECVVAEAKLLGIDKARAMEIFDAQLEAERAAAAELEEEEEEEVDASVAGEAAAEEEVDPAAALREAMMEAQGEGGDGVSGGGGGSVLGGAGKKLTVSCNQCKNKLFIAAGRDDKFFGADFKCANCGAGKDQQTVKEG